MNITKNNVLGFSIIDNRLKIFVKQGTISQSQNSQEQSQVNPNLKTYYAIPPYKNNVFRNVVTSIPDEDKRYTVKIISSDNITGRVGINVTKKVLINANVYIESFCEVDNLAQFRDKSPDAIKLITEGEAKFENGNWILTKKPVVKYE